MFERPRSGERTILVHVDFPGAADPEDLLEFTDLARSAGARPVATITASRSAPEPRYYVGSAKAEEIRARLNAEQAELGIFNHELSPSQERNLEKLLQARVLDGAEPITCRPADLLKPEVDKLTAELKDKARDQGITLAKDVIDDVLIYALFPQIGLKFLKNRGNPAAFEPAPGSEPKPAPTASQSAPAAAGGPETYNVKVNGQSYTVEVAPSGAVTSVEAASPGASSGDGDAVPAPLAGNIFKVEVKPGQRVQQGDVVIIMEAMKMETEVRAPHGGTVTSLVVKEGDSVALKDPLLYIR